MNLHETTWLIIKQPDQILNLLRDWQKNQEHQEHLRINQKQQVEDLKEEKQVAQVEKKKNHKSIQKKDNKEKDTLHEISWSVSFMSIL